jgi:hypothetical protein
MKAILLASVMTLAVVGNVQAGTLYIPTITLPGHETKVGLLERLFGVKPRKVEDWDLTLEIEDSRSACEKAIYNSLDGDFNDIRSWKCVPFEMR